MDAHVVHSRAEGEVEDHHEKKSVMKKVKAKAKKLKDTIAGYSHQSHEQEGQRTPGDHDLDEEETIAGYSYSSQSHEREGQRTPDDHDLDEEDDEVDSPEVSAPKYDSGARRTDAPAQGDILKETFGDTKVGRDEVDPVVPRERSNVNVTDPIRSNVPGLHGTTGHGATHNSGGDRMTDAPGQGGIHSGEARHEYDPVVPRERTNGGFSGPVSDLGPGQNRTSTGHEDLLGVARTKLAGPATGPLHKHEEPKELGGGTCTPLNTPVSSLPRGNDNSATMDVDPVKTSGLGQGGHLSESRLGKTDVLGEETPLPQSIPVSEEDPHAPKANPQADTPSNYETKVTDPTKSAGGEETGVTPVLHSFDKMNLHGDDRQYLNNGADQDTGSHDQFSPGKPSNQGSSYISSAASAISNTAISAKNVVASKLGYGGTESAEHDGYPGAGKSGSSPRQHQNQVLDPATNQFRPAETPQIRGTIQPDHNTASDVKQSNQSGGTYTEKISSATSAIAGRALSAKNVVTSKLGYGSSDQVHDNRVVTPTNVQPGSTQADQQGKGKPITSTVAEKLSPVYGKVAGAGTAVMSKFKGGSTASTGRDTSTEAVGEAGKDKRGSVKDYLVEKLSPGEEDRALSKVISEKLQIHKPGVKEQGGDSASAKPMGKVTESEEVRQRLGSTEGNDNYVVNKIEDSVGSMLGGTNKNGDEHQSAATGENRRLQESGN
uniref:low-temperature-induced 65 kDa protein isoform X2 n=1 Tax=Fragaria vesca subsp. vesca TaxID=101020 RepID=UPI0005C82891|nr:PREDICTED: low-temperature-induced 65 kDa protein isoform X2 [Fragaria vesca subsp. vesca]